MGKVKILVVEDEVVIADNICMILEDLGYELLEPAINYEEALETIISEQPDIAILDIQLGGKRDGIDLAWKIKEDLDFPFIFLTSNADAMTVERAKKLNPPAYLVKPFNKDDLYTSIELALYNFEQNRNIAKNKDENLLIKDAIFVKEKNLYYKVQLEDIAYLKSDHVYVELFTDEGRKYLIRGSLTDLSERLPKYFYRVHRSYTVNIQKMDAINSSYIIINNLEVPISKNYRDDLMKVIRLE